MSTFMVTAQQAADNVRWHVIDAEDQVLGRIATAAARLLQGKHKAIYTPFLDTGDHVVVVNAAKVKRSTVSTADTRVGCARSASVWSVKSDPNG
jgi:large subunit ribosomal protein L13